MKVARAARDGVHGVDELPTLLPEADVVVVAVRLNDSTVRLVDAGFLARMRDGALLVNVARGAVVDTDAVVAEISTGRLRAALDVTDPERCHRITRSGAYRAVRCTPHVAGATPAPWRERRAAKLCMASFVQFMLHLESQRSAGPLHGRVGDQSIRSATCGA